MIRPINIAPVLNGFTVQIGCQTLAYTNIDKLLVDLGSYLREPEKTENRIIEEEGFNRQHTMPCPVPQTEAHRVSGLIDRRTDGGEMAASAPDTAQTTTPNPLR